MCHYSQDDVFKRPAQSITPDQFQQLFEGIASSVGEVILSCADEPLASKFFPEILAYLRRVRSDVIIRFFTNAMLMTAPLADVDAALAEIPLDPRIDTLAVIPTKASRPELIQAVFERTFCTRRFSEIVIRTQNEVMPYPWHRTPLGTLSELPRLSDHFFGPRFQELRQAMLRPEGHANCQDCPLKSQELPSARHDN